MLEGVRLCVSGLPKPWPGRSEQDLQETARFWIACRAVAMARVMLAWKGAPPPLPPTSLSLDRDAVNVSELSALLAATGQNCLQFPITYPDGSLVQAVHPPKLRLALRNSTVVVSIHMRGEIPGGDYMQREESDSAEEAPLPSLAQDLNFSWLKNPLFPALYRPPARRRLIAFGRATSDHTLTASLYDLAVAPSLQRRGFGRQVLQRIIRDLGRRGITDIAALTSPEQRPFFIACGFAEDELNSTTMLYTRSSTLTNKDCVKQFGRKHLLVPAALKSACMPPLEHHHTDRS